MKATMTAWSGSFLYVGLAAGTLFLAMAANAGF